jgi:hypothetical protein
MESITIKKITDEILPARYNGVKEIKFIPPEQIIDGSICYITIAGEPVASYRVRFDNVMVLGDDKGEFYLKTHITNLTFIKPADEPVVSEIAEDNVAEVKPVVAEVKPVVAQKVAPKATRGRGKK